MSKPTYFVQECPTCGRSLRIRVEHLGRQLTCQHCRGKVAATDPEDVATSPNSLALLRRADELLNQTRMA